MVPVATVESTGTQTAILETDALMRTDRDRSYRVFRSVLFVRELLWRRVVLWFQRDIPFLRLLVGSKGGEVIEVAIAPHGIPPVDELH